MGKKYEDKVARFYALIYDINNNYLELYDLVKEFILWPGKSFDVTYLKIPYSFNPTLDEHEKEYQDKQIHKLLFHMMRDASRFVAKSLNDKSEKGDELRQKAWYPLSGFCRGVDPEDYQFEVVSTNNMRDILDEDEQDTTRSKPLNIDNYQVIVETTPENEEEFLLKQLENKYGKNIQC